jgi:hypothetical protein
MKALLLTSLFFASAAFADSVSYTKDQDGLRVELASFKKGQKLEIKETSLKMGLNILVDGRKIYKLNMPGYSSWTPGYIKETFNQRTFAVQDSKSLECENISLKGRVVGSRSLSGAEVYFSVDPDSFHVECK